MTEQSLSVAEEQAFQLSQAAIMLDAARRETENEGQMAFALQHNLEVWVVINTIVKSSSCLWPSLVKDNLSRLAQFVADRTLKSGGVVPENTLDTLININLQISEGLLEAASRQ